MVRSFHWRVSRFFRGMVRYQVVSLNICLGEEQTNKLLTRYFRISGEVIVYLKNNSQ